MKTKSISIETIISGFSHIFWILLVIIFFLHPFEISELIKMFSGIGIGEVAILASLAFGASFCTGVIAYLKGLISLQHSVG